MVKGYTLCYLGLSKCDALVVFDKLARLGLLTAEYDLQLYMGLAPDQQLYTTLLKYGNVAIGSSRWHQAWNLPENTRDLTILHASMAVADPYLEGASAEVLKVVNSVRLRVRALLAESVSVLPANTLVPIIASYYV